MKYTGSKRRFTVCVWSKIVKKNGIRKNIENNASIEKLFTLI